jgi:phytoene dehydrogenase-like protein
MTTTNTDYDVIVIGSGMGGLAAAAIMARLFDRRVLVLERHHTLGGLTQTFQRPDSYEWDVGLHYVGRMHRGTSERALLDFVTERKLRWKKTPEPYEKVIFPDFSFEVLGDPARYKGDLIARFPAEAAAIERYFVDVKRANRWMLRQGIAGGTHPLGRAVIRAASRLSRKVALANTAAYLDAHFEDDRLKALLTAQWGNHGLPPSKSIFGVHAALVAHYLRGTHYPVGGASKIAEHAAVVIESRGGTCLANNDVKRILIERKRAIGVEAEHKTQGTTQYLAPAVISDAGAYNTYTHLLPAEQGTQRAKTLRALVDQGSSMVVVYLGLTKDPADLGLHGESLWINESYDHDRVFSGKDVAEGKPLSCSLTFPSMKNPQARGHTAVIMTSLPPSLCAQWSDSRWAKRGEEYETFKNKMAEGLIDLVERHHPGLREIIDRMEVSTPLSIEHFVGSPVGATYGIPALRERFELDWLGPRTPIAGLVLTGADAFLFGIVGAAMGAVAATGALTGGIGFMRIMTSIHRAAGRAR